MRRQDTLRAGPPRLERRGRRARKASSLRKDLTWTKLSIDVLEDRRMMSVTTPVETTYRDLVSVEVIDRHLFYNNSSFDGGNPAIGASDDGAIASDKSALLPGQSASFANYSSYSRGINGLMVDIAGLPTSQLTAGDFEFRVGNNNAPGSWTTAAAPTSISVRLGAGVSGSARVEIVWPDGAIQKQWLQVTVKATPNTGLTTADVFYFGSAVGESGNAGADAIVDSVDAQGAANNPINPAPIASVYDFNRDGLVNAADATVATNNATTAATALKLVATPAAVNTPPPERLQTSLFNWGDGGYPVFNNPTIVTTANGVVLAFVEGRATTQDSSSYAIVMRRSTDGGISWSPPQEVVGTLPSTGIVVSQPAPIVDLITGEVLLLFNQGTIDGVSGNFHLTDVHFTKSTDDGLTWATPIDITHDVTVSEGHNPGPLGMYPDTPWGWAIVGPGHGIQIQSGPYAGRLIVPGDHRETEDNSGKSWSHVVYSDDHGQTWKLGGGLVGLSNPDLNHVNDRSNENTIAEIEGGGLYMSIRVNRAQQHWRGRSFSFDGGITWSNMQAENDLNVYQVHGSVVRLNDDVLLFSSPASVDWEDEKRHQMTIWASYDNGQNWTRKKVVFFGYAGYSDMTVIGPDTVLLTFARGWTGGLGLADSNNAPDFYGEIGLARINLRWLESDDPYEFDWYFNEKAPGEIADYRGSGIQDYGPWDQRAWARASGSNVAATYVAGAAGDTALRLTSQPGASGVILSQAYNTALQAGPNDSFTVQIMLKTADADGTIIGTRTDNLLLRNWSLVIVGGKVQFSLFDTVNTATITSPAAINDGQWHHIAAVRDAAGRLLHLYIDHVEVTPPVVDTATKQYDQFEHVPVDPVYLGAFNTLAAVSKLDVTVDTLRFTRAALAPDKFFGDDLVSPTPPPPKTYLPNNPTSIPGLQLWLPAYDPAHYFSDFGSFTNPLPLSPFVGMATRSIVEASSNDFQIQTINPYAHVLHGEDAVIGPYWNHKADPGSLNFGSEWWVHNKTGSVANSFDFVQNTGVFTLSTFVNIGAATGGYMTIFDTSEGSTSKPGFSLFLQQNGVPYLAVTGGTVESVRFFGSAPAAAAVVPSNWYHVAAVGTGPGNPIQFYVTPVSDLTVTAFNSTADLTGENGTYPTDLNHELFIASRSNRQAPGTWRFNGGMVNQTIYDTALSPEQVQQLFLFGKGRTHNPPLPVLSLSAVTASQTEGDIDTTSAMFMATLSAVCDHTVLVTYATADGSATTTNNDYQAASGTLTFAPGQTVQLITVQVNGDTTNEIDEGFTLSLANPKNAMLDVALASAVIQNDDPLPVLSLSPAKPSQQEGDFGTASYVFMATLSAASGQMVSVAYSTADGSATTADSDYQAASGILTFAPGETVRLITVQVNGDTRNEVDEDFTLLLGSPTNAMLGVTSASGLIKNDDSPTVFTGVLPAGSQVYRSSYSGSIAIVGDTGSFTLTLDPGQTLAAIATPSAVLQPRVVISGPGISASASATAAGGLATLQNVTVSGGMYTVFISGLNNTVGTCTLELILNAALEDEHFGGPSNNTWNTAQDIDGSFTSLGAGASRAAVLGRGDFSLPNENEPNNSLGTANDASTNFASYSGNRYHLGIKGNLGAAYDQDWYKLGQLQTGDEITISASGVDANRGTLSDAIVVLFAGQLFTAVSLDSLIHDFRVVNTDTYYVAVYRNDEIIGTYDLGIDIESFGTPPLTGGTVASETESNNTFALANDVSTSWRAVQYASQTAAALTVGDSDVYEYQFTAGSLVTIDASSTDGLRPHVTLLDSNGIAIAIEDSASEGPTESSSIYAYLIPTSGNYYVKVESVLGTGTYDLNVYLSSAIAPPIPSLAFDTYGFSLTAGDTTTLAVKGLGISIPSLNLLNPAGEVIAQGVGGASNVDQIISNYVATLTGTYYVRLGSDNHLDYDLIVTKNAAFDTQLNFSLATAQDLAPASQVLGYIDGVDNRYFRLQLVAGQALTLSTTTPGDGLGEFDSSLDPAVDLIDSNGALVATNDNSAADGRNAVLGYLPPISGSYSARLRATAGQGEFILIASGAVNNASSSVVGRHLFYNQSGTSTRYDGNNLAINASDDVAIATDKTAYLWENPGAATFANISSYTKGINGIMVDISGSHPSISADDFIFRVGNNNSPGLWSTANAPTSISVRAGAGVSGSDRVEIIWNGAAAPIKQWLNVIVLANADTGLAQKVGYPVGHGDQFFFGNAVGNVGTGDTSVNSLVSAADESAIRANNALIGANIPITNIYDVGRNASVSALDESAARLNGTNPTTTLKYLNLTSAPAAPEADGNEVVSALVWTDSGVGGVASALSAPAPASLTDGVPKWLVGRIESIDLNSGTPAKLFQYLHEVNTPRSRALLVKFDAVADALGLDDELLDALVADLGR